MEYQLEELSIELSAQCACRCIMCSSGASPKAGPNELTPTEIVGLIRQAGSLGAKVLSFSGGDPILRHADILKYCDVAYLLGYESILIYTTGVDSVSYGIGGPLYSFASAKEDMLYNMACQLSQLPGLGDIVTFVFSLHSHRQQVHDYIMGLPGTWSVTTAAIRYIQDLGFKVWTHMVPMLPNWQDAAQLRDFCAELGVSKMSLLRYVPQTRGRYNRRMLELKGSEFDILQTDMSHLAEQTDHPVQLRFGCPIDFQHAIGVAPQKGHACHAGTDLMLVRPNGDVHPCAAWKTLPDDANVREKPLQDIWTSGHVFQAIRQFREEGWTQLGGPCSMCKFLASCKGGCPAQKLHWLSIYEKDDVSTEDILWPVSDPLCPIGREDDYDLW